MVHENDYPKKIKSLIDELKFSKDKLVELKENLSREQKTTDHFRLQNQQLQDTIRDIKMKIVKKNHLSIGNYSYIGDEAGAQQAENSYQNLLSPNMDY